MAKIPGERLVEHALALIVQGEVAPGEAAASAQADLRRWREKSDAHDAAVREAQRRWHALGHMATDLRAHFPETAPDRAAAEGKPRSRRQLLLSAVAVLGTGALAARGIHWYWQQPIFSASYETKTAQMFQITLADGAIGTGASRLDLAPRSALDVRLYRQRRSASLSYGAVRFDITPDPERPFEVQTRQARIEVVGTVFTVRDRGGPATISVEQGEVRVFVLSATGGRAADPMAAISLRPGQAVDIQDGRADAVRAADTAALSAWRDGWLVFENAPLDEALKTINAYRVQPIEMTDPAVGGMRLTGRFRANDSAGLMAVLPTILPLSVHTRADGGVELRRR